MKTVFLLTLSLLSVSSFASPKNTLCIELESMETEKSVLCSVELNFRVPYSSPTKTWSCNPSLRDESKGGQKPFAGYFSNSSIQTPYQFEFELWLHAGSALGDEVIQSLGLEKNHTFPRIKVKKEGNKIQAILKNDPHKNYGISVNHLSFGSYCR